MLLTRYITFIIITQGWNIQRRLQHLRNINFETKIDEFSQLGTTWWNQMHFVRGHLGKWPPSWIFNLPIWQNIFNNYRNVTYQRWCLYYNLHDSPQKCDLSAPLCKSVTTCPNGNVTTCPNVISITKFVIVEKYRVGPTLHLATYIQGSVYSHNHEQMYIHNIY